MRSKSLQPSEGYIPVFLCSQVFLCISLALSNRKYSTEVKTGPMLYATYYIRIAKSTMVSRAPENVCEKPNNSFLTQRTSQGPEGKLSFACSKQLVRSGDMDHLMQNLVAEGLSDVLPNTKRKSSVKHCEWVWKKWCTLCIDRGMSLTRCNIKFMLEVFADLFEKGLKYRSISTYRSVHTDVFILWPN